jgi:5-methylthioadenosine/S-adenosylhomocysteine deaminase
MSERETRAAGHEARGAEREAQAAGREPRAGDREARAGAREAGDLAGREACDLVVRNGYVITMDRDRTIYRDGAVAVVGRHIAGVGPTPTVLGRFRGRRVIDARGAPVHPGFVEAHYHVPNQLTRGVFPDAATTGEYYRYYARWFDRMDAEDEHAATLMAGLEMLRNGVTCFMEPGTVFETAAVAEAAEAVGIRASLAEPFLWDTGEDATLSHMQRARPDTERCLKELGRELWRNDDPAALVRGHVCLYGSGSASDALTVAATDRAQKSGAAFNQHQSGSTAGVARQEARLGRRPLVHLAELGVLRPHCAYTHMNLIRGDEARLVRESGLSLIWCPANSMNWGVGKSVPRRPHPDLYRAGVTVALGSDVPKWGFDAAPLAAYLLSRDTGDERPLAAEEIFEMATLGGARAMGMADMIGSLEPGKRADIVIRTAEAPEFQPGCFPVQNLLLASRGKSVDTVLVDGRVVVRGGHSTRVDEGEVFRGARETAWRLARGIGVDPAPRWPVL